MNDAIGLLAGFVMTACFATQFVFAKRYLQMDILLVSAISAGVSAIAAAQFMTLGLPTPAQLAGCALFGLIAYGLGTALALAGGRLVKSGEAGFIAMLDVVLGPVWVWLFYAERPAIEAVIGGGGVLAAVLWYLVREERTPPQAIASRNALEGPAAVPASTQP